LFNVGSLPEKNVEHTAIKILLKQLDVAEAIDLVGVNCAY